ncbi:MAG: endonuclease [Ignavibacteria bacterium]|nr:endonuclease [Ignavibacteria bacterium]
MATYLLVWNPNVYYWENIDSIISNIQQNGYSQFGWRCGRRKSIINGDRLFLVRLGQEPKGIVASGNAIPSSLSSLNFDNTSNVVYQDDNWDPNNSNEANYVNILWDSLINPELNEILTLSILNENFPNQFWTPQGGGIVISEDVAIELEIIWNDFVGKNKSTIYVYPDESILYEGQLKKIIVNKYERNIISRKICIEQYGFNCTVCGFNFEDTFGEIGKEFIHVHHLVSISDIGENYIIDPINDLIPVCPNCHSMLHKRNPPFSINELKSMIK